MDGDVDGIARWYRKDPGDASAYEYTAVAMESDVGPASIFQYSDHFIYGKDNLEGMEIGFNFCCVFYILFWILPFIAVFILPLF